MIARLPNDPGWEVAIKLYVPAARLETFRAR